jgi:outer membrane protein assembly factor BamD (BamD/ComL family)
MNTRRDFLKAAACTSALWATRSFGTDPGADPARIALVVGNNAYAQSRLHNAGHDARSMAELLQHANFDVDLRLDAQRDSFVDAIEQFGKAIARSRVKLAIFYYAGHGAQINWKNYLVPVDVSVQSPGDLQDRCIDLNQLLGRLAKAQDKTFIVILDACRDNPFGADYSPDQKGLSQFDAPVGSLLAYATAPGNVAADGKGMHGLYTENLIKEFSVINARIEDAFKRVRLNVRLGSHDQQIPWESTSLENDVILFPTSENLSEADIEESFEQELAIWNRIKNSANTADWIAYLSSYPNGKFSEIAQARLSRLLADAEHIQAAQRLVEQEAMAWNRVKDSGNIEDWATYLHDYPNSEHSETAQTTLNELRSKAEHEKMEQQALEREAAAWKQIQQSTTIDDWEAYLRDYPHGKHGELAQSRLNDLRAAAERVRLEQQLLEREAAAWDHVKNSKSVNDWIAFLRDYPGSQYREVAQTRVHDLQAEAERSKLAQQLLERETAAWNRIRESNNIEDLMAFLREFRNGKYREIAQTRLNRLKDEAERTRLARQQFDREMAAWNRIKDSKNREDWSAYLHDYPNGQYKDIALTRLSNLQAEEEREKQAQLQTEHETVAWNRIKDSKNMDDWSSYLHDYPNGRYQDIAQTRLNELKLAERIDHSPDAPHPVTLGTGVLATQVWTPSANPYSAGTFPLGRIYTVGDESTYRQSDIFTGVQEHVYTRRVTKVDLDADRVEFNGGAIVTDLMGNSIKQGKGEAEVPVQFYPAELYIGKKWTASFRKTNEDGESRNVEYKVRIVAREKVTVPAGQFETFRIEARGWTETTHAKHSETMWVVPGINAVIKHERLFLNRKGHKVKVSERHELVAHRQQA